MNARSEWIERAREASLEREIERRGIKTKLTKHGPELVGPCPRCGGTDRFAVNIKKQKWNCRHCRRGGSIIDLIMLLDGVEFDDACTTLTGQEPPGREKNASGTSAAKRETQTRQAAPQGRADAEREDAERAEREKREAAERTGHALELWHEAGPLNRLSLNYFASRGIPELPLPDVHGVLRLHPRRPFGSGERHPCIIALLRNTLSDAPQAIHRTALTREGRKLDRKAFGPKVGAAIKLWPDADVTTGLVIGEGLETVLAAATRIEYRHTLLRPAWAVVDAANLEKFTVLPGVDALTILVDHDEIGRGQEASRACAHEWTATGREVILLTPRKLGSDFNDVVAS